MVSWGSDLSFLPKRTKVQVRTPFVHPAPSTVSLVVEEGSVVDEMVILSFPDDLV
jgi:hypothetical protein